jgi:hypothetical protein
LRSRASQYLASSSGELFALLITSRNAYRSNLKSLRSSLDTTSSLTLSRVCTNLASLWNALSTMLLNVPIHQSATTNKWFCCAVLCCVLFLTPRCKQHFAVVLRLFCLQKMVRTHCANCVRRMLSYFFVQRRQLLIHIRDDIFLEHGQHGFHALQHS